MKLIDADTLKICLQDHYGVIEQDCSISEKFADGAISGIDAAMFEVDAAPIVDAIPVEWLKKRREQLRQKEYGGLGVAAIIKVLKYWYEEQEAHDEIN